VHEISEIPSADLYADINSLKTATEQRGDLGAAPLRSAGWDIVGPNALSVGVAARLYSGLKLG
jgi:hypothetical protein